ncbi:MAG TPA: hypothetical protein VGK48_28215 [Terriglobia bacterium]|jgi:hypothetical protein
MKMMRVHVTVWLVLLLVGLGAGFIPEYLKNRELRAQLENPQKAIDALNLQIQLSELRDDASLALLEISRQNFGLARDHVSEYYGKLKDLTDTVQDPALKKSLQDLSMTRDTINTNLSTTNAASLAAWQPVVLKTFEVTKSAK